MDAGGLAQMTYNMSLNGGGGGGGNGSSLGVPGSGFASRGKGSHIKRLNLPPRPSNLAQVDEARPLLSAGPRTARSHLLAGLRTAPKQPSTPSTAPLFRQDGGPRRGSQQSMYHANVPHTATVSNFHNNVGVNDYSIPTTNSQLYSLPEHVLAPPPLELDLQPGEQMDERLYAELVSANLYLAAQQQRLQQQLASVTAAAQQFQNMNLGLSQGIQQQVLSPGVQSPMGFYQQQVAQQVPQSMQSVVQAVPGQPGVYCVYNPITGQQDFVFDDSVHQEEVISPQEQFRSPVQNNGNAYGFRQDFASPTERRSPVHSHSPSPPRSTQSPQHEQYEQPPSAALKRNHKKNTSVALMIGTDTGRTNATPKTSMFPPTPATGTFGPGQGRAGEHPARQPRGPPPLEELMAKPTSKCEGSKNFVTRQRRRAVHNLVRAGMERRGGSNNTGGSVTPSSDSDFNFSPTESEGTNHSASVSSRPSMGSLRGVNLALGSDRKEGAYDNQYSPPGGEVKYGGDRFPPTAADVVAGRNGAVSAQPPQRRRMPMFVLSSAEKRKGPNQLA